MFSTLALAAALSLAPAQNATLTLTNDRITFGGQFGPPRPNNKLLPGDVFFLAFDMDGLTIDANGKGMYSMGMDITDSAGKVVYTSKPTDQEFIVPLGGTKLPGHAYFGLSPDQAKGIYKCTMVVTDLTSKVTTKLEKQFEVLPAGFGVVGLNTTHDSMGNMPMPMVGMAGQLMYVHYNVVGFARNAQTKQPNLVSEIRVLDQTGKPTTEKPLAYEYTAGVDEKFAGLPFSQAIPLNRAGTFIIEVKAECRTSGQSYKMSFPITVLPSAK